MVLPEEGGVLVSWKYLVAVGLAAWLLWPRGPSDPDAMERGVVYVTGSNLFMRGAASAAASLGGVRWVWVSPQWLEEHGSGGGFWDELDTELSLAVRGLGTSTTYWDIKGYEPRGDDALKEITEDAVAQAKSVREGLAA